MRPRLLDLYCCAGGSAHGYYEAGFDVVGVDSKPQRNYPFAFIQADVTALDVRFLKFFHLIHASPPCQFGSELTPDAARGRHLNLIPETRALLQASGVPYVIENVRGVRKHLVNPVSLFGTMFGLEVTDSKGETFVLSRERLFETSWKLPVPHDPGPQGRLIAGMYGAHLRCRSGTYRTGNGTGRTMDFVGEDKPALARQLMGMPWATMKEMSEAVPPAYTRYIGAQALEHIRRTAYD